MTSLGLEVLYEGEAPVVADIVFVHGLRGDRKRTWTKANVFWPRDLLKNDVPNARIMSWGYDANVMNFFSPSGQSSIFAHALQLLEDLQRKRRRPDQNVPIIFVAHSLGGLVVKDALCISHAEGKEEVVMKPRLAAIKPATVGIVFAGTPHRGADAAKWAAIATNLAKFVLKDNNDKVVLALTRGSETLERLQDGFSRILMGLKVFSFFEDYAQSGALGKIVDNDSASLGFPHERKQTIPANHAEMVQFDDPNSAGYERMAGAILELVDEASSNPPRPAVNTPNRSVQSQASTTRALAAMPSWNPPEFFAAIKEGDLELVELFIRHRDVKYWFGEEAFKTAIYVAVEKGHVDVLRAVLETGANPDECNEDRNTYLYMAVFHGQTTAARLLLEKGAFADKTYDGQMTPLYLAASLGRDDMLPLLLDAGADPNAKARDDSTPLHEAAFTGHVGAIRLLVNHGADVNAWAKGGWYETNRSKSDMINAIQSLTISAMELTDTCPTPLHNAAQAGKAGAVQVLLANGANAKLKDKRLFGGRTPLQLARQAKKQFATIQVELEQYDEADEETKHFD